jgi:hypothetical protein
VFVLGGVLIVRGRGKYRFEEQTQRFDDAGVSWFTAWKQRRETCD